MKWDVNLVSGMTPGTAIHLIMVLHAVIGSCYLLIALCILRGVFTSKEPFFVYVGGVFGSFLGVSAIARLSRAVCYYLAIHGIIKPVMGVVIVDIFDLADALVGIPATTAVIWITLYFWKHPVS